LILLSPGLTRPRLDEEDGGCDGVKSRRGSCACASGPRPRRCSGAMASSPAVPGGVIGNTNCGCGYRWCAGRTVGLRDVRSGSAGVKSCSEGPKCSCRRVSTGLPYLKYMRPLFPTLATANCLPSRPAEPPSGVISSSRLSFFPRRPPRFSSCDWRSVSGSSGFVCEPAEGQSFVFPRPAGPRPVFARFPSCPGLGGGCIKTRSGDAGARDANFFGGSGC
jgi:hypothetical protein